MQQRKLGKNDIQVSTLGLGTVKLGRNTGLRSGGHFELPDERAARALLEAARHAGINLLDTAPAYGRSEERLGALLAGQRNHWVVCTKVGEAYDNGESTYDFTPAGVRRSVKRSLQRFRTDFLDIVLLHSNGNDLDILNRSGALETLADLKSRGWIRAIGISHKSVDGARRAVELGCDVIMATLNPTRTEEVDVIREAGNNGCGVLVKKALASGRGKPESLRYAANQPGVSSVVVGTINPEHLAENARILVQPS